MQEGTKQAGAVACILCDRVHGVDDPQHDAVAKAARTALIRSLTDAIGRGTR